MQRSIKRILHGLYSPLSCGIVSLALFFVFSVASPVLAAHQGAAEHTLSGFAWSSNIGWLGFNCVDSFSCAVSPYRVTLEPDRTLTGYAWSSSVGWVSFTPSGPYPEAPQERARLNVSTGMLTGWARACTVFASGCSGSLRPDSERGGWDGWIKLSGNTRDGDSYGVRLDGDRFSGFSWGADVVGWVNWSNVRLSPELPDLTAETPTMTGLTPTGQEGAYYEGTATLSGVIENRGGGDAPGTFTNEYRWSLRGVEGSFEPFRDGANTPRAFFLTDRTSPLSHDSSRSVSSHTFVIGVGTWYMDLCADYPRPGSIAETDEANNCGPALKVVIVPTLPSPSPSVPAALAPSCSAGAGKITVSWVPVISATSYRLYRGSSRDFTPADATLIDADSARDGVQDFIVTSFTDSLLTAGATYYYRISALSGAVSGTPSPASAPATPSVLCPDLVVEKIEVVSADANPNVFDPASVPADTPVRFRAVIKNQGGGTEVKFNNQFVVDEISTRPYTSDRSLPGLGAGAISSPVQSDIVSPTIGPHSLTVCADRPPAGAGNVTDETSETNNCRTLTFTVVTPPSATLECYDKVTGTYRTDYCIVDYGEKPKLRWNTGGTPTACEAKGDWKGGRATIGGIENITLPPSGAGGSPLEYFFSIECSR
ncbi:MAG: hypothetical protein Greene041679_64 [Parcubacteria group bacterium Greene0416_79]|nr:MAG: hypothetical protein Greene041679_64 [Parcubacteria group bacterium Greene0416_79]